MQQSPFWNPERITFAAFAGLLCVASWTYLFSPPPSIEAELNERPARSEISESDVRTYNGDGPGQTLGKLTRDPFALHQLTRLVKRAVRRKIEDPVPPVVENPTPPPTGEEQLPIKPRPPKEDPETTVTEHEEAEEEKPFPLIVTAILRFTEDGSGRRVLVKLREGDGTYTELHEDDEMFVTAEETVKVIEITPTSVTFEKPDGSQKRINIDPLDAWRPKLRDESETPSNNNEEPAMEDFFNDNGFDIETLDLGPQGELRPKPQEPPLRQHEKRGRTDKKVRQSDLEDLIEQLKKQNPDLLDQLDGSY